MAVLLLCKDDFYVILSIESAVSAKGELFFMWNNIEDMILYEDRDIIVCHKVAGIAVQSARIGMPDMESTLKNYLASKKTGTMPYLGIVHRLDQPVEGVLVFAKNKRAAAGLTGQITSGSVTKEYLAVTDQKPENVQGHLEDYLKKDGKTNTSAVVTSKTDRAKKAVLDYKVLNEVSDERTSTGKRILVRIQLEQAAIIRSGYRWHMPECRFSEIENIIRRILQDFRWDCVPVILCSDIRSQERSWNFR